MRPLRVTTQTGESVELSQERCEAQLLAGGRCTEGAFRGSDELALCWLHRRVVERGLRPVVVIPVEPNGDG